MLVSDSASEVVLLLYKRGCDLGLDLVDVVKGEVKLKTRCSSDTSKDDACEYPFSYFVINVLKQRSLFTFY